ncbi:hypothetical protein LINPERPRIM_LOCUS23107 [Linum perenne]
MEAPRLSPSLISYRDLGPSLRTMKQILTTYHDMVIVVCYGRNVDFRPIQLETTTNSVMYTLWCTRCTECTRLRFDR